MCISVSSASENGQFQLDTFCQKLSRAVSVMQLDVANKAVCTSAIQLQYNYNNITHKFCCIAEVRTNTIKLQVFYNCCK